MEILQNILLAPFTTIAVGGPAKYFSRARTAAELVDLFGWARSKGENVFVLGGGSNVLVSDAGFDGLVVKIEISGINFDVVGDTVLVTAGAGVDWDGFVRECVDRDLAGVECLSGIPGNVGGTPVQNVGAYGQEVSETIVRVRCFDRAAGTIVELSNDECGFEYRKSIFNTSERERYVVLWVVFRLVPGGQPKIVYKDLQQRFSGGAPSLREARETVIAIRREKSMVIDPTDPNSRSAGSFFKNPIVSTSVADSIAEELKLDSIPQFAAGDDDVKIPAAWLIEQAGFRKGFILGNAGISTNHSLAIINRGSATSAEIVALKDLTQKSVLDKFGIRLQPEPIFIGF
ncbi:MAG: UDP-N-acetylmuramate dehydrogenase [bacterium]|nr:UDP-N-acetylmuramate dehydrogenase [bacterium]